MEFIVKKEMPASADLDMVAIFCFEGKKSFEAGPQLKRVDKMMGGEILRQAAAEKFRGKKSSSLLLFTAGMIPARYALLAGMGPKKDCETDDFRKAGARIAGEAQRTKAKRIAVYLESAGPNATSGAKALFEGIMLGGYRFDKYRTEDSDDDKPPAIQSVMFICNKNVQGLTTLIGASKITSNATCLARDLVNTPAADQTPSILAKIAREISSGQGLSCAVLDKAEIKKARMGCVLAVAKGSAEPPVFIDLTYKPRGRARGHVCIVGKGITFDSGGISLKPPRGMERMKGDMAGAAVVLSTMDAISKLKPDVKVSGIIPAAENMPSGTALKPGDIITSRGGKTVEIISTDSEGRLLLADALSYAMDKKPDAIIDIATLTGGAAYCCGELYSLIMGNNQRLVDKLMKASKSSGEPMWQLPMVEEYKEGYKSGIADLSTSGKGKAQTILGALFLHEFLDDTPWAHIDIAAASWTDEKNSTSEKGATGVMARTMIEFLMSF